MKMDSIPLPQRRAVHLAGPAMVDILVLARLDEGGGRADTVHAVVRQVDGGMEGAVGAEGVAVVDPI